MDLAAVGSTISTGRESWFTLLFSVLGFDGFEELKRRGLKQEGWKQVGSTQAGSLQEGSTHDCWIQYEVDVQDGSLDDLTSLGLTIHLNDKS